MSSKLLRITEVFDFAGKVDRKAGVVRNCKLLGLESANNRRYTEQAAEKAVPVYEGAVCRINHSAKNGPRSYEERLGKFENVHYVKGKGCYGDLRYNPQHPLAEQFLWDAENNTPAVGFSPAHTVRMTRKGKENIVEEVCRAESIDLVDGPATARSVFEQANEAAMSAKQTTVRECLDKFELVRIEGCHRSTTER